MPVGGIDVTDPAAMYAMQYMALGFMFLGVIVTGAASYAITTSIARSRQLRLAGACLMWVLGAICFVESAYVGFLQHFPVFTWSWLNAPRWLPLTLDLLFFMGAVAWGLMLALSRERNKARGA